MAAPLIAGNDVRSMTAATKNILTNADVIAVDQDPLGIQGKPISTSTTLEVWSKKLSGTDTYAVVLFNRTDRQCRYSGDLDQSRPHRFIRDGARPLVAHRPRVHSHPVHGHGALAWRGHAQGGRRLIPGPHPFASLGAGLGWVLLACLSDSAGFQGERVVNLMESLPGGLPDTFVRI